MVLTTQEESLIQTVRALPPQEANKILVWAQQLASLASDRPIEWADSWSEEDLADATKASLTHLDESEQGSR